MIGIDQLAKIAYEAHIKTTNPQRDGFIVQPWERLPVTYDSFYFDDLNDSRQILASLDAIADEFTTTVASLRGFLATTTTLAKLKELMPEAAALIPEASHPIALIPNPGNAMAALTRAGYFDHAQEVAHA